MTTPVNTLIQNYFSASNKLKKFERKIVKRFAPSVAEVSNEFHRLALQFEEYSLYQYAGMCYLGCAKCQKSLVNNVLEIDFYMKSARAFVKADQEEEKLGLRSNQREFLEGALKSYNNALQQLNDDSVMKAALIREIKLISPKFEGVSNFSSPCHRIYDLEVSANQCIDSEEFHQALDKLTDIFDNITERRKEHLYIEVLNRIEILRILLLIILNLPPFRQSPSHIKLIQQYSELETKDDEMLTFTLPPKIVNILKNLICAWLDSNNNNILLYLKELSNYESLNKQQRKLVDFLIRKYFI